jgi:hypothetical protein
MLNVESRDASQRFMPEKIKEEQSIHDHQSNSIASGTLTLLVPNHYEQETTYMYVIPVEVWIVTKDVVQWLLISLHSTS